LSFKGGLDLFVTIKEGANFFIF